MDKKISVTCALPVFEDELKEKLKKSYSKQSDPVQKDIKLAKWTVSGTLHVTDSSIEFAVSNYQPIAEPVKEGGNEKV